jgi:hypothetical protein
MNWLMIKFFTYYENYAISISRPNLQVKENRDREQFVLESLNRKELIDLKNQIGEALERTKNNPRFK